MRTALLAGLTLLAAATPALPAAPAQVEPLVVVAHVDVGVNPYSDDFAWQDPRAWQHPCTYIARYPCSAQALVLTLDEPDFATALAKDAGVWASVRNFTLYWVPGTKVIGAISLNLFPMSQQVLDTNGHGTMTASRSMGNAHSLCPQCLLVSITPLGDRGVTWAAESGFVDVQTNSWGGGWLTLGNGTSAPLARAADQHLVLFASGNGLFGFDGYASSNTYTMATGAPRIVLVGAHDNGHVAAWPGSPPHVIADGYGGWTALKDSVSEVRPDPGACCTSAASPYAAGGAAALVLEARRILGDPGPGIVEGVVARGPAGLVPTGPLADGVLTLAELKRVFLATATLRPVEGRDDGLLHWMARPTPDNWPAGGPLEQPLDALNWFNGWGQNPFCEGCWTTPLRWADVPGDAAWWDREGYGAIDARSVALGKAVLRGDAALPHRALEDALYAADQAVREAYVFRTLPGP